MIDQSKYSPTKKIEIALGAIIRKDSITDMADIIDVSRSYIYDQEKRALKAINDEFSKNIKSEEKILFTLNVTKPMIESIVIALMLHCRSSGRGIVKFFRDIFGFSISTGKISEIGTKVSKIASDYNNNEDLSKISIGVNDELFHHNRPILAGIDSKSYYTYALSEEDSRDHEVWAITLWDLEKKGLNPKYFVTDDGKALKGGHNLAMPNIIVLNDTFHAINKMNKVKRYFQNRIKSTRTELNKILKKCENSKNQSNGRSRLYSPKDFQPKIASLTAKLKNLKEVLSDATLLFSWMERDVLKKEGVCYEDRSENFDFILEELQKLSARHKVKIKGICTMFKNYKDKFFPSIAMIEEAFDKISEKLQVPKETIWKFCKFKTYTNAETIFKKESELTRLENCSSTQLDEAITKALDNIHLTSSAVENLNSRLRSYFNLRKNITSGYLDLLRFYFNHTPMAASQFKERREKSPIEVMTGKNCDDWMKLIGLQRPADMVISYAQ